MSKTNYLPKNLSFEQDKIVELVRTYQQGIDWQRQLRIEEDRINTKFSEKIENAMFNGKSDRYIESVQRKWAEALETDSMILKIKKIIESNPMPTDQEIEASAKAANEMVEMNVNFVKYIIWKHFSTYVGTAYYDDLFNAGMLGLFNSLRFYDLNMSMLTTHATYEVQHEIYAFTSGLNDTTVYYQTQAKQYKEAISRLYNDGVTSPNTADIAEEMGVGMEAVQKLIGVMSRSNRASLDDENSGAVPIDPLKFNPEEITVTRERDSKVREAIAKLPKDQQLVIECLYLNDDDKPERYAEIGVRLACLYNPGVPVSDLTPVKADTIKQLRSKGMRAIKEDMKRQGFAPNDEMAYVKSNTLRINLYPQNAIIEELNLTDQC